ncbi:MAG: hypothetical protein ACI861_002552 [Paracoccaceae bacterium]|jgi:hypothetical protein
METIDIFYFVLLGLAFIVWAFIWFRALFALKAIADQRRAELGAGYFRSIGITVSTFSEFAFKPEHQKHRRQVILVTIVLFAIIFGRMWFIPTTA